MGDEIEKEKETLNYFLNTYKYQIITVIVAVLLLVAVFYWGKYQGRAQMDSDYLREREERGKVIAEYEIKSKIHDESEVVWKAKNELLKRENEAMASLLEQNDAKLKGDATKFNDLMKKRNEQISNIDSNSNVQSQVCGLCEDAKNSGFSLSPEFCKQCRK